MQILFTVCGRAGSKGVKNKNLKDFLGHPLLFYTFAAIKTYCERHSEESVDIAFNTDSKEMMDLVRQINMQVDCINRKKELSGDTIAKSLVIADTLREMEKRHGTAYDIVIDCDITSPLRTIGDIENLIEKKINGHYDVVFSVTEARRNPYFNMVKLDERGNAQLVEKSQFAARQQAPNIYDMNASLYAYSPDFLYSGKRMFDGACGVTKMLDTGILDIDCENDFELMQVVAEYLFETNDDYKILQQVLMELE